MSTAEGEHRSFSTLLAALEGGATHDDLTRKVQEIVAELHNTRQGQGGKPKASIVLRLDFRLDSDVIECTSDVKSTLPKQVRDKTILYATPDNNLTQRNPRQQRLPFRDANEPDAEARSV